MDISLAVNTHLHGFVAKMAYGIFSCISFLRHGNIAGLE
jgi:hypothetical protein